METAIFDAILITVVLAIGVVWLCNRLRVPAIVGFLLSGTLAGPHGLGLVSSVEEVEDLAEIGVVLLLFTIGLEFSLRRMVQIGRLVVVGGALQVGLTIAAIGALSRASGLPGPECLFLGFLASLSSTAIVLKVLQERGEVDSPHGRALLGILIFQDIIVVPMMLVTPQLGGKAIVGASGLLWLLAKAIVVVGLMLLAARWAVPALLYQVARTRSRELFLLTIVITCLVAARATYAAGLSLALGAFLAGLAVSESEYSHHTLGGILPLRDIFTSFFFISMGMLLDLSYLGGHLLWVLGVAAGVMVVKALLATIAALLLGLPLRTCLITGISLAQVGEFSFVLSKEGIDVGLLGGDLSQLFIAGSIVTMSATPFMISASVRLAEVVSRLPVFRRLAERRDPFETEDTKAWRDHLVIVGFGVNGRNVARAAKLTGIPYIILEMNAETVREQRALGEPIYYGDATHEAVLRHAQVQEARAVVVAINDPAATRAITRAIKEINPAVHLIVRTRYVAEMRPLYDLGADEVIPEEFETSVEIFSRVLAAWLVPEEEIIAVAEALRAEGYEAFRAPATRSAGPVRSALGRAGVEIRPVRLPEESPWASHTLGELGLRTRYSVTVVAVRRGEEIHVNPDGTFRLEPNDVVVLLGKPSDIGQLASAAGLRSYEGQEVEGMSTQKGDGQPLDERSG